MHLTMFTDCGTGGGSVFKVGNGCLGRDLGMIYSRLRCGGRRMGELNLFFFFEKENRPERTTGSLVMAQSGSSLERRSSAFVVRPANEWTQ